MEATSKSGGKVLIFSIRWSVRFREMASLIPKTGKSLFCSTKTNVNDDDDDVNVHLQ